MKKEPEPRTNQIDFELPISAQSFNAAQREYFQHTSKTIDSETRRNPLMTAIKKEFAQIEALSKCIYLPKWNFLRKAKRAIERGKLLTEETTLIDTNDQTVPTNAELQHPFFWIKMLRYAETGTPFPDRERANFFYSKAIETALYQIKETTSLDTSYSMLALMFSLTVRHEKNDFAIATKNTIAIHNIAEPLTEGITAHLKKIKSAELPFQHAVCYFCDTLDLLSRNMACLIPGNPVLPIYKKESMYLAQFVAWNIAIDLNGRETGEEKYSQYKSDFIPLIYDVVKRSTKEAREVQLYLFDQLAKTLFAFLERNRLDLLTALETTRQILTLTFYGSDEHWEQLYPKIEPIICSLTRATFTYQPPQDLARRMSYSAPFEIRQDMIRQVTIDSALGLTGGIFITIAYHDASLLSQTRFWNKGIDLRVKQNNTLSKGCTIDFFDRTNYTGALPRVNYLELMNFLCAIAKPYNHGLSSID